ncbi:putative von Willebrand factor A [Tanacetum coccineum]
MDDFSRSVHAGLQLSKRISYGKNTAPPRTPSMTKTLSSSSSLSLSDSSSSCSYYDPTSPMVYAVITDPSVVENPEICSYQPHVYGKCDPPALVPLHMHGASLDIQCWLDTVVVSFSGVWRVHCVASCATCDCRIVVPMGEQGSVLGMEVETARRSYSSKFITRQNEKDVENISETTNGFLMKGNTYMFKISQVEGGSYIQVNVRWSQKMVYQGNEFRLTVPFTFPPYVVPVVKGNPMKEKILLNVNSGTESEITCNIASHPLRETRRQAGELGFSYEAEVKKWSSQDIYFAFSPFRKEVVFLLDISASMQDDPLEKSKDAVLGCLSELNQEDTFNIIAFNGDIQLFSSSLELATDEAITRATEWTTKSLIAEGGTNLLLPLKQAFDMVGKTGESIPLIFLITDGSVEDEKDICNIVKDQLVDGGINCPRICTFGIGSYCNHYFLQMLAHMGRGCYDAAYDVDCISDRLPRLLTDATSSVLANITLDGLENLDSLEMYPFRIPDLYGSPLVVSGRYNGKFPDIVKARGIMADMSTCVIDAKVRNAKGIPLDRVCARREIDSLTARAWLGQNTQLEDTLATVLEYSGIEVIRRFHEGNYLEVKITKMSLQRGVPSEYTRMILVQSDKVKPGLDSVLPEESNILYVKGRINMRVALYIAEVFKVGESQDYIPEEYKHWICYVLHWLVLNASIAAAKYVTPAATCAARDDMHVAYYNMVSEESFVIYVEWINSLANVDLKNNKSLSSRYLVQNVEIDALVGGVNDLAFSHPNKQLCVITFGDDKTIEVWPGCNNWR